jgi:hypothetical protein
MSNFFDVSVDAATIVEEPGIYAGIRKGLVLLLLGALLGTQTVPAFGQTQQAPAPSAVENQVKKWGVGKSVKMTLQSGEQVSGHIRAIGTDSFTVKVHKTERDIPYAQVAEIKDPSPLTWMLVGAAVAVVVIILIFHH